MSKAIKILPLLFFLIFPSPFFAEINVISPEEGNWNNKQMLVIDTTGGGDFYYSLNGTNPEDFGFIYDGPVFLDIDKAVDLRIIKINQNGSTEGKEIKFSVNPDITVNKAYSSFIQTFLDTGIINYVSGTTISIPSSLEYSLGSKNSVFISGRDISISEKNILTRYIPCILKDKASDYEWRFLIKTFPRYAGIYSQNKVPFSITNWDTVNFTDETLLYKIDNEFWEYPKTSKIIDRSVDHIIYWQSVSYNKENIIKSFRLPAKPVIKAKTGEDGVISYSVEGDSSYKMGVLSVDSNKYEDLFSQLSCDVFYGDKASGSLEIGLFSDSVFQGVIPVTYDIDKCPPQKPVFITNARNFYSREDVHVEIQAEDKADVYVALSSPYIIKDVKHIYESEAEITEEIKLNPFKKVLNGKYSVDFKPKSSGAVFFKIQTYAKYGSMKSDVSEYSVIIDHYNYYFNKNADPKKAEGTALNPFTSFDECINAINKSDSVRLNLKGEFTVPEGEHQINSKLEIVNDGDAVINFEKASSLIIKNDFSIKNCKITTSEDMDTKVIRPLFNVSDSHFNLENCQISADFSKNGSVIEIQNGSLILNKCFSSVSASVYSVFVSGISSSIEISDSVITSSSTDTSVITSLSKGKLKVINNSMKISGKNGRILELFDTEAEVKNNRFNAELENPGFKVSAIYANGKTKLTEQENELYGF